jgi:hypothetical protein
MIPHLISYVEPGIVLATGYRLDDPGSIPGIPYSTASRPDLGPTQPLIQLVRGGGLFPGG